MNDEARPTLSALQAWASGVMAGNDSGTGSGSEADMDGEIDRAPGQARYDPADVISVFMGARESGKHRDAQAKRNPVRLRWGRSQPS